MSNADVKYLDVLVLQPVDYAILGFMLCVSMIFGIYFGLYKKQNTTLDYLLGGRKMGVIPIMISLAASYTSAVTVMGMPAEMYSYGSQYLMSCVTSLLTTFISGTIYLPVFYELKLMSSFEYLSLRFDNTIRVMASFLSVFGYIIITPIMIYTPALALNLVSGINIKYISLMMCAVCIFYTTIGGFKAVVWSDTIQWLLMYGSIFTIIILGIPKEGGLKNIWNISLEGDRIEFFNLDTSFYTRMTMWGLMFGMVVTWISNLGVNQVCIQRFLSLPSLSEAKIVLYMYSLFVVLFKSLCLFVGMIIYTKYHDCDPISIGKITKADQILPYYILDLTKNIPGMPGLFIAGIFSASLSTISTFLNSISGIIYKDFIASCLSDNISEETASKIMKFLVVLIGSLCLLITMYMEKLNSAVEISISFDGIASGALLGIFTLGMLFPRVNSKGTIVGAITSLLFMIFIIYNSKKAMIDGYIQYPKKTISVENCDTNLNITIVETKENDLNPEDVFFLFRVSFMWYSLIGFLTTLIVAIPISYMTEPPSSEQTKPEYFSPVIRKYFIKEIKTINVEMCEYDKIKVENENA